MRVAFFGTPAPVVPILEALDHAHEVAFVVTQPERRRGRGAATEPSPVHAAATSRGIPVRTPTKAGEVTAELTRRGVEVGVVAAFGQILPETLLDAVPRGLVNVHLSVLPRWRGAAPVERAILAGDDETGVSIMRLDAGLDTGPVYRTVRTTIDSDDTAGELTDRLIALGLPVLLDVLAHLPDLTPVPQVGEATYAEKLRVEEFHLDPSRPADELVRVVRAGNPRPGAWLLVDGKRVKVLAAHAAPGRAPSHVLTWPGAELGTAAGRLVLDTVQVEGKQPVPADAWLAGFRRRTLSLPVA